MKKFLCPALLIVSLGAAAAACPSCYGLEVPGQSAEGPGGLNLGRLRRVYSSSRYNQPVRVEVRPAPASKTTPAQAGEPIPVRVPAARPEKPKTQQKG